MFFRAGVHARRRSNDGRGGLHQPPGGQFERHAAKRAGATSTTGSHVFNGTAFHGTFPHFLAAAIRDVADATGLTPDWLNPGPTSLLDFGLPPGFEQRTTVRRFGGLTLHVASRKDQICSKLYASVDQGPQSKHTTDLKKLRPSPEELRWAGEWCRTQDPSDGFAQQLELALRAFGGSDDR